MKNFNRKRQTGKHLARITMAIILTIIFSLGMLPDAFAADNGTALADEYVDLGKVSGYQAEPAVKLPDVKVNTVRIDSAEVSGNDRKLTKPGDYSVELIGEDGTSYGYRAICYRRGDANADARRDVRDLVAAKRTEAHGRQSERYGADMDGDGRVTSGDYRQIRELLVGRIQPVFTFDLAGYAGTNKDPNAYITVGVEKGAEYTFRFSYYVEGRGTPSVINAKQAWGLGSAVAFTDNRLTGKGTYSYSFTADCDQVIPVFQAHTPYGAPKLYVWNLQLVRRGSSSNLLDDILPGQFKGPLINEERVSVSDMNPDSIVDEPIGYNTAILYNEQHSSYDAAAEEKRQELLNVADTVLASATGTIYYVSPYGNDKNDGKTKETAWKSLERVEQSRETLKSGDAVLLERGGVYRGNMILTSGVSYGAYGDGTKPCIYGSARNYARPWLWQRTDSEHIWKLDAGDMPDIGNIVFEHGENCGLKKQKNTLTGEYEFYHDTENGMLYLYLSSGNPGIVYRDIEICSNTSILSGEKNTTDVRIENLCLKYGGAHGIVFRTGSKNITIQGCEIGYVGGSMLSGYSREVRYGNGIEILDNCDTININNNWVYQCYDAGVTHQSGNTAGCKQQNITISGNLIEYCTYNIEYYVDVNNGLIRDTVYENNVLRFAGFGFGSVNRTGSDNSMDSNICCYVRGMPCRNFVIQNNIFDCPKYFQTTIGYPNDTTGQRGPVIRQNSYIQKGNEVAKVMTDGSVKVLRASDLAALKESLGYIDSDPASVIYEK